MTTKSDYDQERASMTKEIAESVSKLLVEDDGWFVLSDYQEDDGPCRPGGTNYYLNLNPSRSAWPLVSIPIQIKVLMGPQVYDPLIGAKVSVGGFTSDIEVRDQDGPSMLVFNSLKIRLLKMERESTLEPLKQALSLLKSRS